MIPERFTKAKYEDAPEVIRKAFEKMSETKKGIYIHGPVGSGKTHIAYALKKQYDRETRYEGDKCFVGRSIRFWNTTELLREMRKDFDREAYEKRNIAEDLYEGLLILDDLGSEKMTEWVEETFYLIVNKRYENIVPTIFTSNFAVKDLSKRVGDRTASRIVEMCELIELVGADIRTKNIKQSIAKL